jgi:proliferating cell nuclear antigen
MSIHESLVQTDDAQIEIETTASVIKPTIAYGRKLVNELNLHVDSDGLHYEAVDPANVAMVGMDVPKGAFEAYTVDETVIGLNMKQVNSALRAGRQREDDSIVLSYSDEMLSTTVRRDYDGTQLDLQNNFKTIDPDSVRGEPELPDLELDCTATIPRDLFEDVVKAIDITSDYIRLTNEGNDLVVIGEGATDDTRAVIDNVANGGTCDSIFSLDYIKNNLVKGLKAVDVDEITLHLDEEFPVHIEWETEMNDTTVTGEWFQAPRVSD